MNSETIQHPDGRVELREAALREIEGSPLYNADLAPVAVEPEPRVPVDLQPRAVPLVGQDARGRHAPSANPAGRDDPHGRDDARPGVAPVDFEE